MGSVICTSCVESLTTYNKFVTICESTEERINSYHDMQQSDAIIKLSDVLTFLSKGICCNNVNIEKEVTLDNGEYSSKGPDVKEVLEKYQGATCDLTKHNRNHKRRTSVQKDISQMQMCESPAKHGEDVNSVHQKDNLKVRIYKCAMCAYKTKLKANLKRHLLVHKDISELYLYECKICEFKTKYSTQLNKHMLGHKVLKFKCKICEFQTKQKGNLKRHMWHMGHMDTSEGQILKCEMCKFYTKRKGAFILHLLAHTNILEDQLYKFESCE
ncbi:hypothetical protein NQ317_009141 [Molorchus minor]|uniref:C2H2-type domain-containing protein n=1 Tax=Molorchus minor TaxID=1323400 RepID=A0ABQ9JZF8_9CUCU|nr:hypothetical protein NQ317_009141 [Molorchus minor]